jgi:hypothetical protein
VVVKYNRFFFAKPLFLLYLRSYFYYNKMKKPIIYLFCLPVFFFFASCDDIIIENTPENVFEVFWRTMDENYMFFEEKGIDWNAVYRTYAPRARNANEEELLQIFREIIEPFPDRNVRIVTPEYWIMSWVSWDEDEEYMLWCSWSVLQDFGFEERELDMNIFAAENKEKGIAFFQPKIVLIWGEGWRIIQHEIFLSSLSFPNGLIIDLTSNTVGNVVSFVSAFFTGRQTVAYMQYKTGRGHNDFGNKIPIIATGKGYVPDDIPIVIVTNRFTYSTDNFVIYALTDLRDNVTVIGLPTGGGTSISRRVFLPNGWRLEFPGGGRFLTPTGRSMEHEFEPDIRAIGDEAYEKAIEFLVDLQRK